MNLQTIVRVLNIAVKAMFIIIGIFLLAGLYNLRTIAPGIRITIGVILILYGAFRIMPFLKKKESGDRE